MVGPVFIISDNTEIQQSLERYFRFVHDMAEDRSIHVIQPGFEQEKETTATSLFNRISSKIDEIDTPTSKIPSQGALAILDFVDREWNQVSLNKLNPLQGNTGGIAEAVAMLMLAYPEIHWLLHTPYNIEEDDNVGKYEKKLMEDVHRLSTAENLSKAIEKIQAGYTPLFDPAGLRNLIKENIASDGGQAPNVPKRKKQSASIDDEPEYAWLEAYTAYRFGYRGHTVTSYSLFEELFNEKSNFEAETLFDDLFLNFPDRSPGTSLSSLKEREKKYPMLTEADNHIVITTGHNKGDNRKTWIENRQYLFSKRMKGKKNEILHKPFAGIFDLWKQSNLERWLKRNKGLAKGFEWPPDTSKQTFDDSNMGHSAPGRLLAVAEKLIERSRKMLKGVDSVQKAVHGAMLALEARELLGNRTPTTSLEALSLKHQFEVKAECMFYGVEYHFDVDARIKDIKKEINSISYWFNQKEKRRSALNAEIGILNKLSSIYRQHGQFDEENQVMDEMRKLHTRLWSSRKPVRWALYPIRRYIEILMSSVTKFALAILVWILLFGAVYYFKFEPKFNEFDFGDSLAISTTTFLGLQPPDVEFWGLGSIPEYQQQILANQLSEMSQFWFVMPAILGFIHLGIFISHLYMVIQRRA